jgi:hypothetical protein
MKRALARASVLVVLALIFPPRALAQDRFNFPDRKAIVLDICPHLKLTSFTFENTLAASSPKNFFRYEWRNVSNQAVPAFELVTLKYDPFDEPMLGSRPLVAGRNSADFAPPAARWGER